MNQHCFEECTFIIFGATGDLSKRKLIPAIYKLIEDKKLCKFAIVGLSFDKIKVKNLLEQSKQFIKKLDSTIWNKLVQHFYYQQIDFHDELAYPSLRTLLEKIEKEKTLPGNRAFYLATMPDHFVDITKFLAKYDIAKKTIHKQFPWYRVVYEKPFGYDLISSQKINSTLINVFSEEQIFRIDHYLGKELVENIAMTRFTNIFFEPLWNNKYIEEVQIVLSEKLGIEGRGAYYDSYGATKDMLQSHMLQMLALSTMEQPKKLVARDIRNAKANVLKKVSVESVIKAQYDGYKQESAVKPNSTTETFVAIKLLINNKRWHGVPFYLKTGKNLDKKESSIYIKFKETACLLASCPSKSNHLIIKIFPDEGLYLGLNVKIPGEAGVVAPITMDFCHSCLFGPNTPAAYETLLSDVIKGDQSAFVRSDEVEISWNIIKQIEKKSGPIYTYPKGSKGPKELGKLDPNKKIAWHV